MQELQKIAVVIDADNTQISKLEDVFHEISTRGRIVVKRAYGNWHKPTLKNWGEIIKRLAIKAEQQFDYVSGKNATDMALVIDTIELLYTNLYDAFVIVSSDSDYTPLAIKLREAGVYVMGVGEQKTPVAFRNACDEFLFLENCSSSVEGNDAHDVVSSSQSDVQDAASSSQSDVQDAASSSQSDAQDAVSSPQKEKAEVSISPNNEKEESTKQLKEDVQKTDSTPIASSAPAEENSEKKNDLNEIHALLEKAYDTFQDEDGWVNVAKVGLFLRRAKPDFDSRTYGFQKLSLFLKNFPEKYDVKIVGEKPNIIAVYRCVSNENN
ncbi:NYN domain-containing protein [Faecalibacterium prausnitzii]|uniref:NYN domain-containing protein n=1 Tax=Faecalibacterium prausnitzii TaxID=853 RepID=UPI0032B39CCC